MWLVYHNDIHTFILVETSWGFIVQSASSKLIAWDYTFLLRTNRAEILDSFRMKLQSISINIYTTSVNVKPLEPLPYFANNMLKHFEGYLFS